MANTPNIAPPVFPTAVITSLIDDVGPVQGAVNTGGVTDDATPMIIGTADPGSLVTLYDGTRIDPSSAPYGGSLLGTTLAGSDGAWSLTPAADLKLGSHSLSPTEWGDFPRYDFILAAIDGVGGGRTTAAPVVNWLTGSDGQINFGVTHDPTPMLLGLGEAGSFIWLSENGVQLGDPGVVSADETWTLTPTVELSAGQHHLTVTATHPDGSGVSLPTDVSVLIDPLAPTFPPYIVMVIDDVGPEQGMVRTSQTDDARPTLIGSGTPGTLATVYDNGVRLGTTPVVADGTWAFTPDTDLAAGQQVFTTSGSRLDGGAVLSTDLPGWTHSITIGPDVPVLPPPKIDLSAYPPVITSVVDDVGAHQGAMMGNRGVTDDTQPTINGTSYLGTPVIEIFDNGVQIGETSAWYYGWSFTPATPLALGLHAFTVTTSRPDALAPVSTVYPFELLIGPPDAFSQTMLAPVITGVLQPGFNATGLPAVNGHVPDGGATDQTQPMIAGTAEPGTRVDVFDNGRLLGQAQTGADWVWSLTPTDALTTGEHTFTATAYWQAEGDIGTSAPASYSVSVGSGDVSIRTPVITGFTDSTESTLQGTAQPGCKLELFDWGDKIGEAVVGADWQWQFTPTIAGNTPLFHEYMVRSTTPDGEASAVSLTMVPSEVFAFASIDSLLAAAGLPAAVEATPVVSGSVAVPAAQASMLALEHSPAHDLAY